MDHPFPPHWKNCGVQSFNSASSFSTAPTSEAVLGSSQRPHEDLQKHLEDSTTQTQSDMESIIATARNELEVLTLKYAQTEETLTKANQQITTLTLNVQFVPYALDLCEKLSAYVRELEEHSADLSQQNIIKEEILKTSLEAFQKTNEVNEDLLLSPTSKKELQELALICEHTSSPLIRKEWHLSADKRTNALAIMCQKLKLPDLSEPLKDNRALANSVLANFKLKILYIKFDKLPEIIKSILGTIPNGTFIATQNNIATLTLDHADERTKWIQFMLLKLFYFKGLIDGKEYMERILEFKLLSLFKAQQTITLEIPNKNSEGQIVLQKIDYSFGPGNYNSTNEGLL